MNLKVKVSDDGVAYVAAIDPSTGEHRKSATVVKGQEVNLTIDAVTSADEISFGEVTVSDGGEVGGGNEGSPAGGDEGTPAEGGGTPPDAPPAGQGDGAPDSGTPAGSGGGDQDSGGETPPTTSAASEKPLYLIEGDTIPEGFEPSGLETAGEGKELYHFAGDTAGQTATGNVDGVSVYADADDNEKPVQPAAPAESEAVTS